MMHPSFGHEDDDTPSLPEGVNEESIEALARAVAKAAEQVGLYATPMVQFHSHEDGMLLIVQFDIGDVAFTKRVQDPEQDKFDDQFRKFEADDHPERVKGILERFVEPDDD